MTRSLTEGKPLGLLVQFTAPILLSMLFQQFYNLVDTMIVGRILGENALAAVSSTSSINFMIIGFSMGVCNGFAIPMAQAFGAKEEEDLKRFIGSCVWLCVAFSLVLAVSTGLLCVNILQLMSTPHEILKDASSYIGILFWGIPVTYLYNMTSAMLRAVGDSRTPVVFLGMAAVLNIALDILLITWGNMGVAGAAVATVIAQGVSGFLCLIYIGKKFPILQPRENQWNLRRRYALRLCSIGLPMGLQYSVTAIGSVILQSAVNTLGTTFVAAVGAANKLSLIVCCPFDALGSAIATYAGQNIGAGKPDRVRQGVNSCMLLGSIYAVIAFGMFVLAGSWFAMLFADPSNTVLIGYIRHMLVIVSMFYIPLTAVNVYRFCIQGMGYSFIAILAGVMEMFGRASVAALVGVWGFNAACFAGPAAWLLADSFLIPAYRHFLKKEKKRYVSGEQL